MLALRCKRCCALFASSAVACCTRRVSAASPGAVALNLREHVDTHGDSGD